MLSIDILGLDQSPSLLTTAEFTRSSTPKTTSRVDKHLNQTTLTPPWRHDNQIQEAGSPRQADLAGHHDRPVNYSLDKPLWQDPANVSCESELQTMLQISGDIGKARSRPAIRAKWYQAFLYNKQGRTLPIRYES